MLNFNFNAKILLAPDGLRRAIFHQQLAVSRYNTRRELRYTVKRWKDVV